MVKAGHVRLLDCLSVKQRMSLPFRDTGLSRELIASLFQNFRIQAPTRTQHHLLRAINRPPHRDLLLRAPTGTGKSLALLLSALSRKRRKGDDDGVNGPVTIYIVPTRDLAWQLHRWCRRLLPVEVFPSIDTVVQCLVPGDAPFGSEPRPDEVASYPGSTTALTTIHARESVLATNPPHVLIATPTQLSSAYSSQVFSTHHTRLCILDEVDRLLDIPHKHAPKAQRKVRERHPSPTNTFLTSWLGEPNNIRGHSGLGTSATDRAQLVAASASLNAGVRNELTRRKAWFYGPTFIDSRALDLEIGIGIGGLVDDQLPQSADSLAAIVRHHCILVDVDQVRNLPSHSAPYNDVENKPVDGPSTDSLRAPMDKAEKDAAHARLIDAVATAYLLDGAEHQHPSVMFIHPERSVASAVQRLQSFGVPAVSIDAVLDLDDGHASKMYVATTATARGLDIPNLKRVYIVGTAPDSATYMHLAGRTGRLCGSVTQDAGLTFQTTSGSVISVIEDTPMAAAKMRARLGALGLTHTPFEHIEDSD